MNTQSAEKSKTPIQIWKTRSTQKLKKCTNPKFKIQKSQTMFEADKIKVQKSRKNQLINSQIEFKQRETGMVSGIF